MLGDLYSQPLLTMADVTALLARIEGSKRHVICASDMFEQVRDAVYGGGFGYAYRVVKCAWLEPGQVLLGPSDSEVEAMLQTSLPGSPLSGNAEAPAE